MIRVAYSDSDALAERCEITDLVLTADGALARTSW